MMNNTCTRCGKQRIETKKYQEVIGNSKVIYTDNCCPDKECQKKVDEVLERERLKREQAALLSAARNFRLKPKTV